MSDRHEHPLVKMNRIVVHAYLTQKKYPCVWCWFGYSEMGVSLNIFINLFSQFVALSLFSHFVDLSGLIMGVVWNMYKGFRVWSGLAHLKNCNSTLKKHNLKP